MSKIAVDTNVLIFLYDEANAIRKEIAERIVLQTPVISSQVVSEFLNVTKRLLKIPKQDIVHKCIQLMENCLLENITLITIKNAEMLIGKYDFQLFDSLIVAAALQAGCTTLYSEDMQHGLVVEKSLTIINPFLSS